MDEGSVDSVTRIRLKKPDARRDDGERPSIARLSRGVYPTGTARAMTVILRIPVVRCAPPPLATRSPSLRAFAASSAGLGDPRGLLLHEVRVRLRYVLSVARLSARNVWSKKLASRPRPGTARRGRSAWRTFDTDNPGARVVLGGARERVPHPRFAVSPQVARHGTRNRRRFDPRRRRGSTPEMAFVAAGGAEHGVGESPSVPGVRGVRGDEVKLRLARGEAGNSSPGISKYVATRPRLPCASRGSSPGSKASIDGTTIPPWSLPSAIATLEEDGRGVGEHAPVSPQPHGLEPAQVRGRVPRRPSPTGASLCPRPRPSRRRGPPRGVTLGAWDRDACAGGDAPSGRGHPRGSVRDRAMRRRTVARRGTRESTRTAASRTRRRL